MISAGFAEAGGEGRALQDELAAAPGSPGCGLWQRVNELNGGPAPRFNPRSASTSPHRAAWRWYPVRRARARRAHPAHRPFAGVSGLCGRRHRRPDTQDLLLYLDDDPATGLILAYLEWYPTPAVRRTALASSGTSPSSW